MKLRAVVGLAVAVAGTFAGITLLRQGEPAQHADPNHRFRPVIYLLDARRDSSESLEKSLPVIKQLEERYQAIVLVRTAATLSQLSDYKALFDEFERTRDATRSSPMFFALGMPFSETKKRLRAEIDNRASLPGESRSRLLSRLVIVRDTEGLSEGDECWQLDDDIAYATWSFLGIGLLVSDRTIQELKKCVQTLAPAG